MMFWLSAGTAALVFTLILTRYLASPGSLGFVLDEPNHRSMHETPTPRSGGLGFVLVLLALMAGLVWRGQAAPPVLAGFFLLAAVSYADDRHTLTPLLRLITHALAALALAFAFRDTWSLLLPGLAAGVGGLLLVLAGIWLINLYNFMDGMDGFAGGMAVIGFSSLALVGALAGQVVFAGSATVIAAAVAGFLVFNFPPARIFMGDVGSACLGFAVAWMAVWGVRLGIPVAAPMMIFAPFWVDATLTLAKRSLRGARVWEAHAEHYYQRLVRAGWPKRRVVFSEYALMALCAVVAVVGYVHPALLWPGVALLTMVFAVLAGLCHRFLLRRG